MSVMPHEPRSPLDALLAALDDAVAPRADLLRQLLAAPISLAAVDRYVRFSDEGYVRQLVRATERYEVRVLCWRPGQGSPVHDHGDSHCAVRVLSGVATETVPGATVRRLSPGEVTASSPGFVHALGNDGAAPLVTLHVYSPPLSSAPAGARIARGATRIGVVGGGFCGTALAVHLLRGAPEDVEVALVEKGPVVGRGVAYGTGDDVHLLNVPAAKMSLDPARPADFLEWWRGRKPDAAPSAFAPRRVYGDYVRTRFGEALATSRAPFARIRDEAVDAEPIAGGLRLRLRSGRAVDVERLVLATGHLPPVIPSGFEPRALQSPRLIADAWEPGAVASIGAGERVLVLGTGLTAIDVLLSLRARGHRGPVLAVSRRGLLPQPHLSPPWTGAPWALQGEPPATALGLAGWVRRNVEAAAAAGVPWQVVVDALRPRTAGLWGGLPVRERARFLARVKPYWEVLRHRAPVPTLATLQAWRDEGGLDVAAARVAWASDDGQALVVRLARPDRTTTEAFDRVVVCTGADVDLARSGPPLIRRLLERGLIRRDELGLGLDVARDGVAVERDGGPSATVSVLGAMRRPLLWETTAVPELAVHAASLATKLLADVAAV